MRFGPGIISIRGFRSEPWVSAVTNLADGAPLKARKNFSAPDIF
jgi:hypothetical protein